MDISKEELQNIQKSSAGISRNLWVIFILMVAEAGFLVYFFVTRKTPDALTQTFIPFQSNFYDFTDAYLIAHDVVDSTPLYRFITGGLAFMIFTLMGFLLIRGLIFKLLPSVKRAFSGVKTMMIYFYILPLIGLLIIYQMFIPNQKIVINRELHQIQITTYDWWVLPKTSIIKFSEVSDIKYEHYYTSINANHLTAEAIRVYIVTNKNEKLTIGANQIDTVYDTPYTVNEEGLQEANNLIAALKKIVGLPANEATDTK